MYKTEILFGLYNLKRSDVYESTFSNKLGEKVILRPTDANIESLYEEDTRVNDWRYTEQWMTLKDPDGNEKKHFVKYMAGMIQRDLMIIKLVRGTRISCLSCGFPRCI